jgi:serine/threonine protein kinase
VLVLDYLSGGELLDHLASGATCEAHLAALFRQVAAGLAYMHGLDIMHR